MNQPSTQADFAALAAPLRKLVEAELRRLVRLPQEPDARGWFCPPRLQQAMAYSLLAGGKRLRPLVVLFAAQGCGGSVQEALPAACAVEMIHTYSLIHDDLPAMDDDDLRRGRATLHRAFDEATAILAGDALLTLAFEVLARDLRPASVAARCAAVLARAAGACGMVGGQADDLAAEGQPGTLEQLQAIHRRKTAALFSASAQLGALCAGAGEEQAERLARYGQCLGLAFQIRDDLLDRHGEESQLGKRVGKDDQRGKLTYPALLGKEASWEKAKHWADQALEALARSGAEHPGLVALARFVLERNQ